MLVGLMGAGKTSVGKRLAKTLSLPFVDADHAIEEAAGCTIEDFFTEYGEAAFRDGERKVIERLLDNGPQVLATGGGAFMDPATRERILSRGYSVWLRADIDVLFERVSRRGGRPLLKDRDPRGVLAELMAVRYPVYGEADITVDSDDTPHEMVVDSIVEKLRAFLAQPHAREEQ